MVRLGTHDEISPARQRANVEAAARERGLDAEIYQDAEGHRSGRTEKRAGWQELKAQLNRPEVKAVIVESLSRASRSVADLFTFIQLLEARHIALISLKEQFDTASTMGRMTVGVIALLNQFESDIASERLRSSLSFVQKVRRRHVGPVPFGTERDAALNLCPTKEGVWWLNGYPVVGEKGRPPCADEVEATWRGYHDAVLRCYELFSQDRMGIYRLRDALNGEGYRRRSQRTQLPALLTDNTVRCMIDRNRLYAGFLGFVRHQRDEPLYEAAHAPIVPVELCDKVAAVARKRQGLWGWGTAGGRPAHIYLLRSVYCADCGAHLTGRYDRGRRFYRHEHRPPGCEAVRSTHWAGPIEAQVWKALERFDTTPDAKEQIRAHALRASREHKSSRDTRRTSRELERLRASLERLNDVYINDGRISKEDYQARLTKLEDAIRTAESQLSRDVPDVRKVERALQRLDEILSSIKEGSPAQQRDALDALIKRVETSDGTVLKLELREWALPFVRALEAAR